MDETFDYKSLIARKTLRGLSPSQALAVVVATIEQSYAHRNVEGTRKAIEWCAVLKKKKWLARLDHEQQGELLYFEAIAWGDVEGIVRRGVPEEWDWAQGELTNQLVCLRTVLRTAPLFKALEPIRQCQVLTNLANALNRVGRTVEALDYWSRALAIEPHFGMALGNRAKAIYTYAGLLYDPGHQEILLRIAVEDLGEALKTRLDNEPQSGFEELKDQIVELLGARDSGRTVQWDRCSLGRSKRERQYRQWCLDQRLFLNPLNDISARPLGARDILCLPSLTTGIGEGLPPIIGLFNNLKQEYASARFLLYAGLSQTRPHYSDRQVLVMNTLDYPSYGLGREQVKAAFRMAYSILDKVAFLLNAYVGLGVAPRDVSFRTIWFDNQDVSKGMLAAFHRRPNLPMRGLYWVSRDMFEDRDGFKESAEPDAQQLQQIRNHIEHRYLKVHEEMWTGPYDNDPFRDKLAVSIYREELEAKALRMLKIARAALIYVVCAVNIEEQARPGGDGLVGPIPLDTWDDDWKV